MHRYGLLGSLVTTTGERYNFLDTISSYPNKKVFRLEHKFYHYRNVSDVISHAREVISAGNEGLLFKTPDHIHEFKRSAHWFKLKGLYLKGCGIEVDLPVIGFEYGKKGTRLEKVLGAFICEYKGNKVRVSGKLSDDQRIEYAENLPSFIEVNADSETDDGSLRLPIFQRVRVDK
jgi:ATP-dependent DNA ligase